MIRGGIVSESVAKARIEPERTRRIVDIPRFFSRPIPARSAFATDLDKRRRPCAPIAAPSAFAPPSAAERGPAAGCGRGGANCAGPQTGCGVRVDRWAGPMPPRPGAPGGARRRPRGLSGTSPRVQRRRATEKSADAFARGARSTGRCTADAKSEHNAPAAPDDNMVTAAEGRTGDRGRTAGTGALRGAAGPRGRSPAPAGRLRGALEKPGRTGPAQETMVGDKADQCSS